MKQLSLGKNLLGTGCPCFIVAELSANHGGDLNTAIELIHAAKTAGADAVKLQSYTAETITIDSMKDDFLIPSDNPWQQHRTLFSLYKSAQTPWEWHKKLFEVAHELGLEIFSSPFDHTSVDMLEQLNSVAYKIASPEITDIPLITKVAKTGKPLIISTGVANEKDISLAVQTIRNNGNEQIIILKCTSAYPTPLSQVNLRTMPDMSTRWDCLVGLSDHTQDIVIPATAMALGACFIEKHLVLSKNDMTADAFFSLDPQEFSEMVTAVRNVEKALGQVTYDLPPSSQMSYNGRRSLYICDSVKKGEKLTSKNVRSVRPSFGLHPKYYESILGCSVTQDLDIGDRLSWDVIDVEREGG